MITINRVTNLPNFIPDILNFTVGAEQSGEQELQKNDGPERSAERGAWLQK